MCLRHRLLRPAEIERLGSIPAVFNFGGNSALVVLMPSACSVMSITRGFIIDGYRFKLLGSARPCHRRVKNRLRRGALRMSLSPAPTLPVAVFMPS